MADFGQRVIVVWIITNRPRLHSKFRYNPPSKYFGSCSQGAHIIRSADGAGNVWKQALADRSSPNPRSYHSHQANSQKEQGAADIGDNVTWDTGPDPENISIKRDPAIRAFPKSEAWAVRESQVQMNTVNISRNCIADEGYQQKIDADLFIEQVCYWERLQIYRWALLPLASGEKSTTSEDEWWY